MLLAAGVVVVTVVVVVAVVDVDEVAMASLVVIDVVGARVLGNPNV